jgi:hypothetical protein
MGTRGGYRKNGGRKKGSLNKATIEKQEIAAKTLDQSRDGKIVLGKDVLEEMMGVAKAVMAQFQPVSPEMAAQAQALGQAHVRPRKGNLSKFGQWFDRAVYAAKELTKYQSPTMRALAVSAATTPGAGQAGDDAKLIEGKVIVHDRDPIGASRVYRQIVAAAGRRS